jgi:hypothetical protein
MSGWSADQEIEQAVTARLAEVVGPVSAAQMVAGLRTKARTEVLAEVKVETVAWLVKKAAEQTMWDAAVLASKVDRGAVRAFLGTGHYRDAMDAHRAETLREAGWAPCYPEWLTGHPGECPTAPRVPGDGATSHWHPAVTRAQVRAEVLTEAAAELDRIADIVEARVAEHYGPASGIGPGSAQMLRDAAGNVRYMARKDTGGAVQAPTGESTETAPSFFRPDRTYQRRRWLFQCLAVSPAPFNGETRAVGFLYRPGEPATATAMGPDDWEQGGWTEATKDGGRP